MEYTEIKDEIVEYSEFETINATNISDSPKVNKTYENQDNRNSTEANIDDLKQRIKDEAKKITLKKLNNIKSRSENVKKLEERVQASSGKKSPNDPKIDVDSIFMADLIKKLVNKKIEEKQGEIENKNKSEKKNKKKSRKNKNSKRKSNWNSGNSNPAQGFITISGSQGTTLKNNHIDNNNSGNSGLNSRSDYTNQFV